MAHFDLYRIHTENDLAAAGFYDYLDQGAVVAAEWSENFAALLAQEDPIRVDIQILDQTSRKITIEGAAAMNILAVDTAGKTAGVALMQDGRLLYEVYFDGGLTHSETLLPLIDTCLKLCGLTCADIDLFGVNAGPGSFTGLRIGLAAVKGLAFPRNTPCAPVSTLEALAAGHVGQGTVLCALDARRGQVYSAAFDLATHARLLVDDARAAGSPGRFCKKLQKSPSFLLVTGLICVIISTVRQKACCRCPPPCGAGGAAGVALAAQRMAGAGLAVPPEALLPDYHRLSQAERERAARLAAGQNEKSE